MFSHVFVGASDLVAAKRFYDATFRALGLPEGTIDERGRVVYRTSAGVFGITKPINGEPPSVANGTTIGFAAATPEQADAWHSAGLANGGVACENPPGLRELPVGRLYLAYLRDPQGHKLCCLHRVSA